MPGPAGDAVAGESDDRVGFVTDGGGAATEAATGAAGVGFCTAGEGGCCATLDGVDETIGAAAVCITGDVT